MRPHRVRSNIRLMLRVVVRVTNAVIHVAALPDFRMDSELPFSTVRETAFDKLRDFFDSYILARRNQQMNVVPHNHKLVQLKFSLVSVGEQGVEEKY